MWADELTHDGFWYPIDVGAELFAHRYRERPHRRAAVTHMFQEGDYLKVVVWHLDDCGRSRERRAEGGQQLLKVQIVDRCLCGRSSKDGGRGSVAIISSAMGFTDLIAC